MKKLKKLAALLLAGAMVMMLFTACGGSTGGENTQAESRYMQAVNASREKSGKVALQNDNQELKERASKLLDTAVDINTGKFNGNAKVKVETGWEKTTITVVSACTYDNTKLDDFLNSISFNNQNVDVKVAALWTDVGVVVKTIQGQTYIAVSVEISNPLVRK